MPHRLGNPKLDQIHAQHLFHRARVELRRAADGIQIHRAGFLQGRERLWTHAALADHGAHSVLLDNGDLVWLLADAGSWTRGLHHPAVALLQHYGAAMVEDGTMHVYRWRVLHQMRMHGVAPGEHLTGNEYDIADVQ